MTKEEVDKVVEILLAFKKNKQLQWKPGEKPQEKWRDFVPGQTLDVLVDELVKDYRIKPEPKLVPFTFEDRALFRDKWLKVVNSLSHHYSHETRILRIRKNDVELIDNSGHLTIIGYEALLVNYVFADTGEPCGKLIEE